MDIGYRTYGVTIINPSGKFKTINLEPVKQKINLTYLSIPDYILLASQVSDIFLKMIDNKPILKNYYWSLEIPNITGSYSAALSILFASICYSLLPLGIPAIFFTGNRLGGYFLQKRSYTKTEILKMVKSSFNLDYKMSDHEADSLLQAYSIYKGIFNKYLNNVYLRDFNVELQDLNNVKD